MRISLNWLIEQFSDCKNKELTSNSILNIFSKIGLEKEKIHNPKDYLFGKLLIGKVLNIHSINYNEYKEHKKSKFNIYHVKIKSSLLSKVTDINTISYQLNDNLMNNKVVVALFDSVYIKKKSLWKDIESKFKVSISGIILSIKALELGNSNEAFCFSKFGLDPKLESNVAKILYLHDKAIELSITPDKGHCLSLRGLAREYAVAKKLKYSDPITKIVEPSQKYIKLIHNFKNKQVICKRYITRKIYKINNNLYTPIFILNRLYLSGVKIKSFIENILNYVMIELGQPIFAYDLEKIKEPVFIRKALNGDCIKLKNNSYINLDINDFVTCDQNGPISLTGIIQDKRFIITKKTKSILIESAFYDPKYIAKSSRKYGIFSEESKRFERFVDWKITSKSAQRVVDLFLILKNGIHDVEYLKNPNILELKKNINENKIIFPLSFVKRYTDVSFSTTEVIKHFKSLGIDTVFIDSKCSELLATVPSWRSDLKTKESLLGEIIRFFGYKHIPLSLPKIFLDKKLDNYSKKHINFHKVKHLVLQLLANKGFIEVFSEPFLSYKNLTILSDNFFLKKLNYNLIKIKNPLNKEKIFLRPNIFPGLINVIKLNYSRGMKNVSVFESGLVFKKKFNKNSSDHIIFNQTNIISFLTSYQHFSSKPFCRKIKHLKWIDIIEVIFLITSSFKININIEKLNNTIFNPKKSIIINIDNNKYIGFAGEIKENILKSMNINSKIIVAEINLDILFSHVKYLKQIVSNPISTFPLAMQDLSLIINKNIQTNAIIKTLKNNVGNILENIYIIDEYTTKRFGNNHKSITLTLCFRAENKTLTTNDTNQLKDKIIYILQNKYKAIHRSPKNFSRIKF